MAAGFRYWHLTSLDAPTVAAVWAWAFAWTAHIRLALWPIALLSLVVWAVYVGDRLLDARAGFCNAGLSELRERHHFHWRHRRVLAPLAATAGLLAAWIVKLKVPTIALPQDTAVALATLAYFSGVHARVKLPPAVARITAILGSRECLVGVLFAAGCVLPAWSMDPARRPSPLLWVPVLYFAALGWLNVRAITCWESTQRDSGLARMTVLLSGVGVLLACALLPLEPRAAALIAAGTVSALLIGLLDRRRRHISPLALRTAVDLALLTPLLLAACPLIR